MRVKRLDALATHGIAGDTETHKVQPGLAAPPLVCMSLCSTRADDAQVLDRHNALHRFREIARGDQILIGQHIAYDLLVLAVHAAKQGIDLVPEILALYGAHDSQSAAKPDGRVYDVAVARALDDIAQGRLLTDPRTGKALRDPETNEQCGYRLSVLLDLELDRRDAKENDRFRTSFALLEDIPPEQWRDHGAADAYQYVIDDVANPLQIALAQTGHIPRKAAHEWVTKGEGGFECKRCRLPLEKRGEAPKTCDQIRRNRNLQALSDEVLTSFALHHGAAWGLRTDGKAIDELEQAALVGRNKNAGAFIELGFLRPNGSENQAAVKKAVAIAYSPQGLPPCSQCLGECKVPSQKTGNPVVCVHCSGTGFELVGSTVPMTEPSTRFPVGTVKIGRDDLIESGDDKLIEYGASQEDDKILDTYIPKLREGVDQPWTLRPNNPLETLRVSYSGIVQLLPRLVSARLFSELRRMGSRLLGVRDVIIPRPGNWFYSNDLKGGELVTFAEACIHRVGFSKMGEALIKGIDVHSMLAATWLGVSYETFMEMLDGKHGPEKKSIAKRFRQAAKPENFGNPGGMGPAKKAITQRKQGPDTPHPNGPSQVDDGNGNLVPGYKGLRYCILVGGAERCGTEKVTSWKDRALTPTCKKCIEISDTGREVWFETWPEARLYLNWHGKNVDEVGEVDVPGYGTIRGGVDFCSEANGDFQSGLAVVAKSALRRVFFEQRVRSIVRSSEHARGPSAFEGQASPLYGVSVNSVFAHDELFGEVQIAHGHEVSLRVNEILIEEFRRRCPHHAAACDAEPTLMPAWFKQAGPVYHEDRLTAWTPEHAALAGKGECKLCNDQKARDRARRARA